MEFDPKAIADGASAVKSVFDGVRSLIATLKELRSTGAPTAEQKRLVDDALEKTAKAADLAEIQVAQALGYQLCRCKFPPSVMLTVGHMNGTLIHEKGVVPVHECPACGRLSSGPWNYTRTVPPRAQP